MTGKDVRNIFKTKLIYRKNGIERNTRDIPGGIVYEWLMSNNLRIRYDRNYGAWRMNRYLSEKLIEEIEKL